MSTNVLSPQAEYRAADALRARGWAIMSTRKGWLVWTPAMKAHGIKTVRGVFMDGATLIATAADTEAAQ